MRNLSWMAAAVLLGSLLGFAHEHPGARQVEPAPEYRPVILVPGWLGRAQDLLAMKERLVRDGWDEDQVFTVEFEDPVGSSLDHAEELDRVIRSAIQSTGARELHLVAHSMGGLAVWSLLQDRGDRLPLHRVVFLATPFHGTVTAHLAWGDGGPEMIPESEFLEGLKRGGWPSRWVDALVIRTPLDLTVVPNFGPSRMEMGDQVICCPTHQGLLDHEETFEAIRNFLLFGRRGGGDELLPGERQTSLIR